MQDIHPNGPIILKRHATKAGNYKKSTHWIKHINVIKTPIPKTKRNGLHSTIKKNM